MILVVLPNLNNYMILQKVKNVVCKDSSGRCLALHALHHHETPPSIQRHCRGPCTNALPGHIWEKALPHSAFGGLEMFCCTHHLQQGLDQAWELWSMMSLSPPSISVLADSWKALHEMTNRGQMQSKTFQVH